MPITKWKDVISSTYTEQSKKPVPQLSLKDTLICNTKHTMLFWDTKYIVVTSVIFLLVFVNMIYLVSQYLVFKCL